MVKTAWDGNDGVVDGVAQLVLCNILHLYEEHGGDVDGVELLLFAHVLDNDPWLSHGTLNNLVRQCGEDRL